jgi:hypothetical protein
MNSMCALQCGGTVAGGTIAPRHCSGGGTVTHARPLVLGLAEAEKTYTLITMLEEV